MLGEAYDHDAYPRTVVAYDNLLPGCRHTDHPARAKA